MIMSFPNSSSLSSAFLQRWEQRLQEQKRRTARSKSQNSGRSGQSGALKPQTKNTNPLISGPKKAIKTRNGQKEINPKKVWAWNSQKEGLSLHDKGHNLAWSACFINLELIDLKNYVIFYIDLFAALYCYKVCLSFQVTASHRA